MQRSYRSRVVAMIAVYTALMVVLMAFAPTGGRASAQTEIIDALKLQATANAIATQSAMVQQQNAAIQAQAAANAQAAAAAAQAQAAAMYAQSAAAAAQATAEAQSQQASMAIAQATVDAAALLATAIAQQTRSAMEAQATQQSLRIEATRQAVSMRGTVAAIDATRTIAAAQADAQRRDNETIATAVAGNLEATRTALSMVATQTAARIENAQRIETTVTIVGMVLLVVAGAIGIWLLIRLARSTALNLKRADATRPRTSSAEDVIEMVAEHERQMAVFRELWRIQREMLDPGRALPDPDATFRQVP